MPGVFSPDINFLGIANLGLKGSDLALSDGVKARR
jgi:hypothetical protein